MSDPFTRTQLSLQDDGIKPMRNAQVFVVGLGWVGRYAAEYLCRVGIGRLALVDGDVVAPSKVFPTEKVPPHAMVEDSSDNHLTTSGTITYMPPLFSSANAAEVIKEILNNDESNI